MSALSDAFVAEQTSYYLQTSLWADVAPGQLLGPPVVLASYDLNTISVEDIQRPRGSFEMTLEGVGPGVGVDALCGWFDVDFRGSDAHPAPSPVVLDTAPDEQGATHWGQQVFYLHPPQPASPGDVLSGTFEMVRKAENHRLLTVHMSLRHGRREGGELQLGPARSEHFSIE